MPSRQLTAAARCHACGVIAAGDPDATDRGAEKHARKGHPVATVTTWEAG